VRDAPLLLNIAGVGLSAAAIALILSAGGPGGSGWAQLADVSLSDRRTQLALAVMLSPVAAAMVPLLVPGRRLRRVLRLFVAALLWALGPLTFTPFFMPAAGAMLLAGVLPMRKRLA
jgi:hypothetical protein